MQCGLPGLRIPEVALRTRLGGLGREILVELGPKFEFESSALHALLRILEKVLGKHRIFLDQNLWSAISGKIPPEIPRARARVQKIPEIPGI